MSKVTSVNLNVAFRSMYDDINGDGYQNYDWLEHKYLKTYSFLSERLENPEYNISHLSLPSFGEHVEFIDGEPYKGWWLIYANFFYRTLVGSIYITHDNEIGLYITKKFRQSGVGAESLKLLENMYRGETVYANVNVDNNPSRNFFEKNGYRLFTTAPGSQGLFNSYVIYKKELPQKEKA